MRRRNSSRCSIRLMPGSSARCAHRRPRLADCVRGINHAGLQAPWVGLAWFRCTGFDAGVRSETMRPNPVPTASARDCPLPDSHRLARQGSITAASSLPGRTPNLAATRPPCSPVWGGLNPGNPWLPVPLTALSHLRRIIPQPASDFACRTGEAVAGSTAPMSACSLNTGLGSAKASRQSRLRRRR